MNSFSSFARQFNILSSSIVTTALPNISPSQAVQSSPTLIKNPLLQTLFKTNNIQDANNGQNHPFSKIGLQQTASQNLNSPNQNGNMILMAKERELIEKQRQINLLLDDKNEKERLLIEALRQQKKEEIVPTYIPLTTSQAPSPRVTSTTTSTTTTTTITTTTIALEDYEEDFRSSEDEQFYDDSDPLDNSNFEVEIILEMTRELVEAKQKEKENVTSDKNENIIHPLKDEKPIIPSTPFEAIMNAREAVIRTMKEGTERTSPAVWAAVKILSDFVSSQDPGLPSNVLQSIIQLTEFLNSEMNSTSQSSEKFSELSQTISSIPSAPPTTTIKTKQLTTLSPAQIKLKEKILKQKLLRQKQINKILQGDKSKTSSSSKHNQNPSVKISTSNNFPSRINLMDVKLRGNQFSFSTLPIYK